MLHIGNPMILKSYSLYVWILDYVKCLYKYMNDSETDVCVGVYVYYPASFLLMVVDSALDCTITLHKRTINLYVSK